MQMICVLEGQKRRRCGLGADHTALSSPVKKLINADEQVRCGAANGGTPQVASKPPEVAIHCGRRIIAKLGTSIDDANQPCDLVLGSCSRNLPSAIFVFVSQPP